ncbi:putative membrane protein C3B8.06 [Hypsizygus marmoreus]|uniref:Membrane protein C3B8.06 n=1 Tax=Hypsizygus marmoreus TaxID=39966 RepID=A0A369JKL1_HYPMA|nr:putative membrane protein C3B8.06 [Hypsizygus marmoreus]
MTRVQWRSPSPLTLVVATALLVANVRASEDLLAGEMLKRDGMHGHHNPHAAPLLQLNETEVTMYHAPTPESYYTIDWEGAGEGTRHPGLILTHIIFMCLAFFVALPIGIAMRSVKHAGHGFVVVAFYGLCALGCASSALYRKLTPNMYEGSVHSSHGYMVMLLALSLSVIDMLGVIRRIISFWKSGDKFSLKAFWRSTILGRDPDRHSLGPEYTGLVVEEPEEFEESKITLSPIRESGDLDPAHGDTAQWANQVHHHNRRHYRHQSTASDGTLFGSSSPMRSHDKIHDVKGSLTSKTVLLPLIGRVAFAVLERSLVFGGLAQVLTGIVIYTGGCRENYINGCLAHLIKGAIFWSYGLVTFARFLGSFSELGWAWNRAPNSKSVSAEFVESLVIFIYGATNMWMERFGAHAGDPFTTKQIQHIGIAVMFCFAGLIGLGIESKTIRNWLAASTFASVNSEHAPEDTMAEPPSYAASFNPFPALVIGVTGAAMAAHAQTYLFQVEIHELWGNLLVAFSVLRCFTYFFLWLGPPRSILPSRPPTEALGSFFLACGGLVFMFSTEEVTIAAMRRGRDDMMMFLNVAVAMTCFAFCWTLFVVGFKGWLKTRSHPAVAFPSSA